MTQPPYYTPQPVSFWRQPVVIILLLVTSPCWLFLLACLLIVTFPWNVAIAIALLFYLPMIRRGRPRRRNR